MLKLDFDYDLRDGFFAREGKVGKDEQVFIRAITSTAMSVKDFKSYRSQVRNPISEKEMSQLKVLSMYYHFYINPAGILSDRNADIDTHISRFEEMMGFAFDVEYQQSGPARITSGRDVQTLVNRIKNYEGRTGNYYTYSILAALYVSHSMLQNISTDLVMFRDAAAIQDMIFNPRSRQKAFGLYKDFNRYLRRRLN